MATLKDMYFVYLICLKKVHEIRRESELQIDEGWITFDPINYWRYDIRIQMMHFG